MASPEESRKAADKLKANAWNLLNDSEEKIVEVGKTRIELKRVALQNGNITSQIGSIGIPGELHIDSTWDLIKPPIDSPDVAEMIRLADILETSSSIGKF